MAADLAQIVEDYFHREALVRQRAERLRRPDPTGARTCCSSVLVVRCGSGIGRPSEIAAPGRLTGQPRAVRAALGALVHRFLQTVEGACFEGYARSLRLQARLSGLPLPVRELGIARGSALTHGKGEGTVLRWAAIERELPEPPGFALDIGSHSGFFSMRLAERGFIVLGFEPSRRLIRIAGAAADRVGQSSVAFAPIPIDPGNVQILPDADVVLVLSVFHDWCKAFGLQRSVEMLDGVWTKTRKVLFFEMPNTVENSSVRDVLPSMGASPDAAAGYIADLLSGLADGVVTLLGHFPTDFRGQGERRHLFVVRRRSPEDAVDRPQRGLESSTP